MAGHALWIAAALALASLVQGRPCPGVPAAIRNAAWPGSCAGAAPDAVCVASCHNGYGSRDTPAASCDGATGVWRTPTGSCDRVCTAQPPPAFGVDWDPTCAGRTPMSARCSGTCASGLVGTPSIQCTAGGWAYQVGQCAEAPVCPGSPPIIKNLREWPLSCAGSSVDTLCTGTCNSNYVGPNPPTSTCLSTGEWSTPTPPCVAPRAYVSPPPLVGNPLSSPCPQVVAFDNLNATVSALASQSSLTTRWGDFLGLAYTGKLSELTLRIAVSGTSPALTGGALTVSIFAWNPSTPQAFGPLLGQLSTQVQPLSSGFYVTLTFPDLLQQEPPIVLPSSIAIVQQFTSATGANKLGTAFAGNAGPPAVGTALTTGFFRDPATPTWNVIVNGYASSQLFYRVKVGQC